MKLILSTLLLSICLTFGGSHTNNDYFHYHKCVNSAFESIAKEDFKNAQSSLESAFKQFDFAFAKDHLIAAQLAAKNDDKAAMNLHLESAMRGGCLFSSIQGLPIFAKFRNTPLWSELKAKEGELRKVYLKSIDTDLLKEFCKRYQAEQDRKSSADYKTTVYNNFDRIKEVAEKSGFPGERSVGLDYKRFAPKLSDNDLGNSKVIVTLLHYDYPIEVFGEAFFVAAIRKGDLHPREFAHIYNYEKSKVSVLYDKSFKTFEELPNYHFNFPFGEKISDHTRVNKDRARFGIVSLEVDQKVEIVARKHGMRLKFGYK